MNKNIIYWIFLLFICGDCFSAEVMIVKNDQVLIQSNSEKFRLGDFYEVIDLNQNKVGLIRLIKVNANKAIGRILEGQLKVGYRTQIRTTNNLMISGDKTNEVISKVGLSPFRWGLGIRYLLNSLEVKKSTETVNLSGNNWGFLSYLGYSLTKEYLLKALIGYEIYNLSGTAVGSVCNGTNTCFVNSNYLITSGRLVYSNFKFFDLGTGLTFKYALQSDSNIVFTEDLKYKSSIDFEFSKKFFLENKRSASIEIGYEYSLNQSEQVPNNSQIYLNLNYDATF